MRKAEQIAALILLGFSLFIFIESQKLPYLVESVPGPGFYPLWLSILLGIVSLTILANTILGSRQVEERPLLKGETLKRLGYVVGGFIACLALTDILGFLVSLAIVVGIIAKVSGSKRWSTILATAVILPVIIYIIFRSWLKIPLPRGFLGF